MQKNVCGEFCGFVVPWDSPWDSNEAGEVLYVFTQYEADLSKRTIMSNLN